MEYCLSGFFQIVKHQITKDLGIYLLQWIILVNMCGLYHLKINIVEQQQTNFQTF